jgi:anthranilate synthase component II
MKKILVIDNYDSFTYNLVHYIERLTGQSPRVYRNDEISLEAVNEYDKILLSPGPGIPDEAGICLDLIQQYAPAKSILGVCLGHQSIGEAFGGTLLNLNKVYHGVTSKIIITRPDDPLYTGIPREFEAGRYHSWVINPGDLPECLEVTCIDEKGLIMGVSHKEYDVRGVQYHPESIMTKEGMDIIKNWLSI